MQYIYIYIYGGGSNPHSQLLQSNIFCAQASVPYHVLIICLEILGQRKEMGGPAWPGQECSSSHAAGHAGVQRTFAGDFWSFSGPRPGLAWAAPVAALGPRAGVRRRGAGVRTIPQPLQNLANSNKMQIKGPRCYSSCRRSQKDLFIGFFFTPPYIYIYICMHI